MSPTLGNPAAGTCGPARSADVAAGELLLVLDQVNKRFGGLKVIVDFDFLVNEEEIVGLIGPNGAGKSTVFNLITGFYRPDSGTVRFRDQDIVGTPMHKVCHLGISRTFQLVRAFLKMTVLENVMTAAVYGGRHSELSPKERALDSLELVGLADKLSVSTKHLTLSDRRRSRSRWGSRPCPA